MYGISKDKSMIKEVLKKNNLKVTNSRVLILESILDLKNNATMKNIISKLDSKMDKSTIYRIILKLIENKIIDKQINYGGEDYYILNIHKHYIHCINCNKVETLNNCPINKELVNGYKIISHSLTIDGICKSCQEN